MEVDNPNRVGLRLDQIDFDLFINDTRVLDSISQQNINIPANGRGDVQPPHPHRLPEHPLALERDGGHRQRGQRARYELRGNAYYDTPVGRLKLPVTVYSTQVGRSTGSQAQPRLRVRPKSPEPSEPVASSLAHVPHHRDLCAMYRPLSFTPRTSISSPRSRSVTL